MEIKRKPFASLVNQPEPHHQSKTKPKYLPKTSETNGDIRALKTKNLTPKKRSREDELDGSLESVQKIAKDNGVISERYDGPILNGLRHGEGEIFYSNGDRYTGGFQKGLRHGKGTYFYADGDRYIGEFINDVSEEKGRFIRSNGDILNLLKGNTKDEKVMSIQYANGDELEITLINDIGNGTLKYNNGDTYVGEFFGEIPHGTGSLNYKNGDKYVGEFLNGSRHGQGIFTLAIN